MQATYNLKNIGTERFLDLEGSWNLSVCIENSQSPVTGNLSRPDMKKSDSFADTSNPPEPGRGPESPATGNPSGPGIENPAPPDTGNPSGPGIDPESPATDNPSGPGNPDSPDTGNPSGPGIENPDSPNTGNPSGPGIDP